MVLCEGCYLNFSPFGYTSHLTQTKKPQCVAQRKLAFDIPEEWASDSAGDGTDDADSEDEEDQPRHFEGDYFGTDYSPGDFAWPAEGDNDMDVDQDTPVQTPPSSAGISTDSGNADEEDATAGVLDEALRPHWEPPVSDTVGPEAPVDMSQESTPPSEAPAADNPPPVFTNQQRIRAEAALHQKVERVYFPSETAGRPLPATTATSSSRSTSAARAGYAAYEKKIKKAVRTLRKAGSKLVKPLRSNDKAVGDEATAYAPFPSRLDWEVARWAKLRGPTSTAVSELLNIGGVRSTSVLITGATHDADSRLR